MKKFKEELLENNYEQQWELMMEKLEKEFMQLSESECKAGLFSAIMFKNNKVYVIKYLNRLIHGLLKTGDWWGGKPQLVSFRVGDLLRCRCTSKEN